MYTVQTHAHTFILNAGNIIVVISLLSFLGNGAASQALSKALAQASATGKKN
jgi:ABC-type dipeptide/oligopeptide/nickel transport system permease subunit